MLSFAHEFALAYRWLWAVRKYRAPTSDEREEREGHGAQWKTVGGGGRALISPDGQILAGCPGLEDEDLDDITDEEPEHRERRRRKQQRAEDTGWESNETEDAREAWKRAKEELADMDAVVLLKLGDQYYSFEDDASVLQGQLGIGDGESADFKAGHLDQALQKLVEAGRRVAIAERTEEGGAKHVRTESPDETEESAFPWEAEDQPEAEPEVAARPYPTSDKPGQVEIKGRRFDVYRHPAGFWFFRAEGASDVGWTAASKQTAEWIEKELGPFEQAAAAGESPPGRVKPKDRFTEAIVKAIGDKPDDVAGFKELVLDIWKQRREEAERQNHALRQLMGNFGVEGPKQGAFIRTIQRLQDPDGVKRFDEMVEFAERYHPELLEWGTGVSVGGGDAEYALFQRLKHGLVEPPPKWDEEIIGEALAYVRAAERASRSRGRAPEPEREMAPFTRARARARSKLWWRAVKYSVGRHWS